MITKFDKGAKAQYYKSAFADCLEDCDYEGAFDNLLKYASEKEFPDFHLACGTLYLQMTQDSDDSELYPMAIHEFLMHIRRYPECEIAYRNILAALFLRGSFPQAIAACRWIRRRGIDLSKLINELAEDGILYLSPTEPADIDGMIDFGEYGDIDPYPDEVVEPKESDDIDYRVVLADGYRSRERRLRNEDYAQEELDLAQRFENLLNGDSASNPSKIVKFASDEVYKKSDTPTMTMSGGAIKFTPKSQNRSMHNFRFVLEKIEKKLDNGDLDENDFDVFETEISADENVLEELHKRLMQDVVFKTEDDYNDKDHGGKNDGAPDIYEDFPPDYLHEEIDTGDVHRILGREKPSKTIDTALYYYENGDMPKVYEALDGISPMSRDAYKAAVLGAIIELDRRDHSSAENLLERAMQIDANNPLAALLLTEIYEDRKQYKKIPPLLKSMDMSDFASVRHVQKIARLATAYCKRDDAMNILAELIDEYNIISLRLIYAQMLYNSGSTEEALDEMYPISRIYYNDINAKLIYEFMRDGKGDKKYKLSETREAPTEVMSAIYDELIYDVLHGRVDKEKASTAAFTHIANGFIGLAYEQPKDLLRDMFATLVGLTENKYTREIALDALTDTYVEAIAKFVILSTLLEHDGKTKFVLETNYSIVSDDTVPSLDEKYPKGYATAYAYMLVFCKSGIDDFFALAESTYVISRSDDFSREDTAYYLIKKVAKKRKIGFDDRLAYALGFASATAAETSYKAFCSVHKNVQRSDS